MVNVIKGAKNLVSNSQYGPGAVAFEFAQVGKARRSAFRPYCCHICDGCCISHATRAHHPRRHAVTLYAFRWGRADWPCLHGTSAMPRNCNLVHVHLQMGPC